MRLFSRNILTLTLLSSALVFSGFACTLFPDKQVAEATKPFTINYWRVFDSGEAFDEQFAAFQAAHPHISINYRRFTYEEYETQLLNALAEDRGPDVLSLHSSWMTRWQPRLLPVPPTLSVPYQYMSGGLKKELITEIRTEKGMTTDQLKNDFVDVVSQDVVLPTEVGDNQFVDRIYGLPLSVDTMVLYYNKDVLNRAGIALPASDWKAFQDQVKKITKLDETGAIIQSAAALGTADNVERASDILALLMMQNGAPMTDNNGTVTFDKYVGDIANNAYPQGAQALIFYSDFANPEKEVYTWNSKMPGSLQAFANGQTAFFFGYAYHLPQIRTLNRTLNFGIAPFPQIEGNKPVNFANYWVEAVSNKTEHPDEVWAFVQYLTKAENAQKYLLKTRKPTALRSLVNSQLEDLDLAVFASQVPSAKSWYHGSDPIATEQAFSEMIRQMLAGEADPKRIVELGAIKVNQTIK